MTEHQSVGAPYNVQGFPTLKFFGADKSNPIDYNGSRDADGIRKFAMDETLKAVNKRAKKGGDSGSSSSGGQKQQSGSGSNAGDKDVVVLDQTNFDAVIYSSKDIWMVEFYAPWCGHCKALEPEWNAAATQMKGKVKFAKVDATENEMLASRFGVRGYPTIKYFDYGAGKSDKSAQDY